MVDDTDDPHRRALLTLADDPAAAAGPSLSAAEVRRRGGRRRVRRRMAVSGVAVATAAAVAFGVGPSLARWQATTPPVANTPTVASPSTPATPSESAPRVIDYGQNGVSITEPGQVNRLRDAPTDFTDFIASIARPDEGCDMVEITVYRVRTDGFASGAFTSCGGYQTIWASVDGTWQEVLGTQDIWTCAELERHAIPDSIAGRECYDESRRAVVAYERA